MDKGHQLSGEPSSINFFEPSKRHNVNFDILPTTNNLPYFTIIKKTLFILKYLQIHSVESKHVCINLSLLKLYVNLFAMKKRHRNTAGIRITN